MSETTTTTPPATTAKGTTTSAEPTRAQAQIARRSAESRAIVPDFTVRLQVVLDRDGSTAGGATFTARVVRACAQALREQPALNGAYRDAQLEQYSRVNVGVMVDTGDAIVTPTIFDADTKDAAQSGREIAALAARARAGEITQPELSGATFTVSTVGTFGVDAIVPVIVPPQAGVLGVGQVRDRVVAVDGAPVVRPTVELTLVCDHRAVYGAAAAGFLARVGELLAQP
ncbi:Dihydrolipoyllysine-residue succinyltransferase component of 2-oxoglutarate dehydrogenase complex [Paraconexibacter sp. AEG42_29]|uniref:Dihydrolipoyllysine-residue succinyltransferase component of 2-oxoglutarate dehydrogenase complex n=1 Tax=Paraconexibacter sp. AEG42_29 TaxID=2997339 RepID=A0AAU7AP61_9ACTN